mmetsp:Transcript_42863/g.118517  ORF Transcript_42863/g.118517 Transcript_42863/m.118517 type:complete len:230 (-) Transcript_42863:8-697(-)
MALQRRHQLACLNVPQFCRVVHAPSGHVQALHAEGNAHDLSRVTFESVDALACVRIPQLGRLVEATSDNFVTEWIVEADRIDHVLMAIERQQLFATEGVPDTASAIVGTGDELRPRLVEGAIRKRQNVRAQNLEQVKSLRIFVVDLIDQLENHLSQRLLLVLGYQWLFEDDLVDEDLDIGVRHEIEKIDGLRLHIAVSPLVLQYNAGRVIPQQEPLQLHDCATPRAFTA